MNGPICCSQYSFPLNLPPSWLGLPNGIKVLPSSSAEGGPLAGELDYEILTAKASKESVYQEAAFFHRCVPCRTSCRVRSGGVGREGDPMWRGVQRRCQWWWRAEGGGQAAAT